MGRGKDQGFPAGNGKLLEAEAGSHLIPHLSGWQAEGKLLIPRDGMRRQVGYFKGKVNHNCRVERNPGSSLVTGWLEVALME